MILHASTVAVGGRGLLILGPSGSGKSSLALHLMALGATLVADDRTAVEAEGDRLIARAPKTLRGLIEARGIGLLTAPTQDSAEIVLVVDLGQTEAERLPPERHVTIAGLRRNLVLGGMHPHFPAAILCYLKGSRQA